MNVKPILLIATTLILPNIAFIAAAQWLEVQRPLLNLDYAIAGIFFAFSKRRLGAVLTILFLLIDALTLTAQVLPFPRIADAIYLLKLLPNASNAHLTIFIIASTILLVKAILFPHIAKHTKKLHALIALNTLLIISASYNLLSSEPPNSKHYKLTNYSPVSSQAFNLHHMRSQLFLSMFSTEKNKLIKTAPGATEVWFKQIREGDLASKLLLVVSESWGVPQNSEAQEVVLAPLKSAVSHKLEYGFFERSGFTLDGELRELCTAKPAHFNLVDTIDGFSSCLPNLLTNQGYETAAMHGATGVMYGRTHWYPRAGFDQTTFFEDKIWPRRCYSFPGACDEDLFSDVSAYFSMPGKRFFYWLTLNSHASYDQRDIHTNLIDCESVGIEKSSESCRNLKLQAQYFNGLANLLRDDSMRDTEIIVVGDHAPVIFDQAEKLQNFLPHTIPWIRLTPNPSQTLLHSEL